MNKELEQFGRVANCLIDYTIKDAYGNSRSKGIADLASYVEELNDLGITTRRRNWTVNSLSIYFCRMKKKYPISVLKSACNYDLIGKSSWEYLTGSTRSEITVRRKCSVRHRNEKITQSFPVYSYEPIEGEIWKESELEEIIGDERRFVRKIIQISKSKKEKMKKPPK
jgi:hypothetical protein